MRKVEGSISGRRSTNLCCESGAKKEHINYSLLLPCKEWRVTAGQLGHQSLTPLCIVGNGRLKLRVAHWSPSVEILQIVHN